MLSFHVKFVQTEGQTDNGKKICPPPLPHLSIRGYKLFHGNLMGSFSIFQAYLTAGIVGQDQTTHLCILILIYTVCKIYHSQDEHDKG